MILADEINRTPPKTQAALLEAMQEHQVTAAGVEPSRSRNRSSCSRLRTRSRWRAPTRCPKRNSTVSCSTSSSTTSNEDDEVRVVSQTTGASGEKIEALFAGSELRRVPRRGAARSGRGGSGPLRSPARGGFPARPTIGNQRLHQRLRELGSRASRRAVPDPGREDARAARRPRPCDDRRCPQPRRARSCAIASSPNYRAEAEGIGVPEIIDHLLDNVPTTLG